MRRRLAPARLGMVVMGLVLVAAVVVMPAGAAVAHPLGNFTVNTYAGLTLGPSVLDVDLVVDMAEIPAYQAHRGVDADGNGSVSDDEASTWAAKTCADTARRAQATVDGKASRLAMNASSVTFPPGAAGLSTLRLSCALSAPLGGAGGHTVKWRSTAYTDRVGWREVTATGAGTTLVATDVPTRSVSNRLTSYPNDLLSSPLDQRSASVRTKGGESGSAARGAGGGRASSVDGPTRALPRGVDAAARSFTELVARRHLSLAFGALALALAVGLGAIHALAPGHGKTVMAAYLVGQRGSLRQAGLIAFTVTTTHTLGVLILGLVLSASTTLAPETVYPWLGLTSGALLAVVGVGLLRRALRGRRGRTVHTHGHSHDDDRVGGHHPEHSHPNEHGHRHGPRLTDADAPITRRALVAMGVAGGMVPSPSALVVLLGALALGRAWFGVALVVAYGVGMAVTLTAAGLILVRARSILDRRTARPAGGRKRLVWLAGAMPTATASIIVAVGLFLSARGLAQL